MTENYNEIAAEVLEAYQDVQNDVPVAMILRKTTAGTYDPAAGTYSGGSSTDYPIVGILRASGAVGQTFFNGVLVLTDDQLVSIAASGLAVDPEPRDLLIITGVTYSIVTMIPVRPGGVDLRFRVLARK